MVVAFALNSSESSSPFISASISSLTPFRWLGSAATAPLVAAFSFLEVPPSASFSSSTLFLALSGFGFSAAGLTSSSVISSTTSSATCSASFAFLDSAKISAIFCSIDIVFSCNWIVLLYYLLFI